MWICDLCKVVNRVLCFPFHELRAKSVYSTRFPLARLDAYWLSLRYHFRKQSLLIKPYHPLKNRMPKQYQCPYCGRVCKTQRGVTQHINQSPTCLSKQELQVSGKKRPNPAPDDAESDATDDNDSLFNPPRRSSRIQSLNDTNASQIRANKMTRSTGPLVASLPPQDPGNDSEDAFPVDSEPLSIRKAPSRNYKTTGEDDEGSTDTSGTSTAEEVAQPDLKAPPPNTKLLHDF